MGPILKIKKYDFIQIRFAFYTTTFSPLFNKLPLHFPDKWAPQNVCHLSPFS